MTALAVKAGDAEGAYLGESDKHHIFMTFDEVKFSSAAELRGRPPSGSFQNISGGLRGVEGFLKPVLSIGQGGG